MPYRATIRKKINNNALQAFVLIAASTFCLPTFASSSSTSTPNIAEQYLLAAANQDRAARGIRPLRFDPTLAQAALFHARQMAAHEGISHQFPGEPELSTRGARAGAHFSLITENVAEAPESTMIHDLWMHSKGHRANLLDPNVEVVGISVVVRDHQFYAVEDFANTVESLSFNQQEATVADLLSQSGLQIANSPRTIEDARRTCSMSTGYAGTRKPWFIMRYTADHLSELPSQLQSRLSTGKYHQAVVGACTATDSGPFTAYNIAVLLYP
jgi:uncharacterized protein YkwD